MRALKQGQGTGVLEPQDLIRPTHVFGPIATFALVQKVGRQTLAGPEFLGQVRPALGEARCGAN